MTAQQPLPPAVDASLTRPMGAPVSGSVLKLQAPPRRGTPLLDFKRPVGVSTKFVLGCCAWLVFLGGWHLAANADLAPDRLFPGPIDVIDALWTLLTERGFVGDIQSSLYRILLSFALALAIALPLGLIMGAFPIGEAVLNPLVAAFRYLPAPAFVPLLLMWLGTGDGQKIALLLLGVIWFLITLLTDVTKQVSADFIETAKTLGAERRTILWTVVLRASLPGYVDTCRQMLAVSWTYLVIAEIVAATDGIGAMMMRARRFVHVDEIMAGILVIGLLGLICDLAFRALYWWAFPYLRKKSG